MMMKTLVAVALLALAPLSAGAWSADEIASRCPDFSELRVAADGSGEVRACELSESGVFAKHRDEEYYYALYCLVPAWAEPGVDCRGDSYASRSAQHRAAAIFTRRSGEAYKLLLTFADNGEQMFSYAAPRIVATAAGPMLYMPIRLDGTGAGNESVYYLWEESGWRRLDSESWLAEVAALVPEGLASRKGAWPELPDLRVRIPLYRRGDANCCPSGGELRLSLAVSEQRFVVETSRFVPALSE